MSMFARISRQCAALAPIVLICGATGALPLTASAETEGNPYLAIVDRNTFGLKPTPPPPAAPVPEAPAPPPANTVRLTGITSVLSKTKALFEITEPGNPEVHRPIMAVGSPAQYGVEVLSIDLDKSTVRIRNGDSETNITFEAASLSSPPPQMAQRGMIKAPFRPGVPQVAVPQPAPSQGSPTVIGGRRSSSNSRNNITVAGGTSASEAMSAYAAGNNVPAIPHSAAITPRSIPSRPIRTPTQPNAAPMTREEAIVRLELQREINKGQDLPPLPPTPLTPGNETPEY